MSVLGGAELELHRRELAGRVDELLLMRIVSGRDR
jgi:hypothetical protein